jgi:hypothetical protein
MRFWLCRRWGRLPVVLRIGIGLGACAVAVSGWALTYLQHAPTHGSVPAPVSHVDSATRVCLLTSGAEDSSRTWTALQSVARGDSKLIVQRYQLPAKADAVAYVNTLIQLRCSRIVAAGDTARSAVASRLADGKVGSVRFVVVASRRLAGTTHVSPDSVSPRALTQALGR